MYYISQLPVSYAKLYTTNCLSSLSKIHSISYESCPAADLLDYVNPTQHQLDNKHLQ